MKLLRLEIERSLRRRMVWVLVAVALAGIAVMGLIAFFDSTDLDPAELQRNGVTHPAVMTDWWRAGGSDGTLLVGGIFLLMGGLIGGAGVVGGEWRTGSLATTLTWEPRRARLLGTRLAAMALCAFGIALVLQAILLVALLPSVLVHGTTGGADAAFAVSVAAAIARIAVLSAMAAVLAGCIASVTRSTAGAIIGVWVWLALVESILRARKPWLGVYLLTENVATMIVWAAPEGVAFSRSPLGAAGLLTGYLALLVSVAVRAFQRADVIAG